MIPAQQPRAERDRDIVDLAAAALMRVRRGAEARGEGRLHGAAAKANLRSFGAAMEALTASPVRRRDAERDPRQLGGYSGAGDSPRDPQGIGGVMDRLVSGRGWRTPVAVGSVMTLWPELVGRTWPSTACRSPSRTPCCACDAPPPPRPPTCGCCSPKCCRPSRSAWARASSRAWTSWARRPQLAQGPALDPRPRAPRHLRLIRTAVDRHLPRDRGRPAECSAPPETTSGSASTPGGTPRGVLVPLTAGSGRPAPGICADPV